MSISSHGSNGSHGASPHSSRSSHAPRAHAPTVRATLGRRRCAAMISGSGWPVVVITHFYRKSPSGAPSTPAPKSGPGVIKCEACGKGIGSPQEMQIRKGKPYHLACPK
jgi:hypothetical protein